MRLPSPQELKSIGVMGFGTMGHTWATALLLGGLDVYVFEANAKVVAANKDRIPGYLDSLKKKGKWNGDPAATFKKLHLVDSLEAFAKSAPVLLEVIFEDMKLKIETFGKLGKLAPADTVFWTNTSCLDVLRIGEASGRPDRLVGTHGMNPVHLMTGVEVVRHEKLSPEVLDFTLAVMRRIGKEPFVTANVPGFIVNNGLIAWMMHYVNMLERRQATTQDIDTALKTSLGHPQGVFQLTDFVGVNTTILVAEEMLKATLDPRYKVPQLLYAMREAGHDGFKTGRGFYDWSDKKNPKAVPFEELAKRKA